MKRAASQSAKKQTRAAKDGQRIKGLEAERTQSRADAVKSSGRIKGLEDEQTQSRADAVRSAELMKQMQEQQNLLELQNEQLGEANASLELSRRRYADLYNLAPVGYITLDGKGCIREINETAAELLGFTCAHLMGQPMVPHLAQPGRKAFLQHLWQCRHDKNEHSITLYLVTKDQSERLVEFTTRPAQDYESKPGWCRTAIADVTERRGMEVALRAGEAKFRLLAENMGEVFWFMELDPTQVTYVSPAFEYIWGATAAELYADHEIWTKAIHPDDLEAVHTAFHRWLAGATSHYHIEYRVRNRQGQVRWIADRGIVICRDGRPHEISGIARDVTERKQAEARFRGLLESAPDAMIIVNQHGLIELVNAQAVKLFGYTREDLIGHSMEMLVPDRVRGHHAGHRANYAESPHARSMGAGMELFARHKDGGEFPVEISLSPLETAEGMLVISAVRDITEQVRIKNEIQHARRFAESTLEAIPASLAVLDATGRIISTNQAWTAFAEANGGTVETGGVGANYLAVCDAAAEGGNEESARFVAGIREVMSGATPRFTMEYPCHAPHEQRWFVGYVTPFLGNGPHSVVIAHVDVSERKRAELVIRRLNEELERRVAQRTLQLQHTNTELQQQIAARKMMEEEILHISEREQQRIGQDLHDDLGQQLAGICLLSDVMKLNLTEQASPEVPNSEEITGLLKNAIALTRTLARGLHPVALMSGGLAPALEELAQRMSTMFRVTCRCTCPPRLELDNTTATHLYRIAQEAVTNAVKHGQAKQIDIKLSTNLRSTVLSVKDQGQGIGDLDPNRVGMGLRIMSYRANMIGGTLDIVDAANGSGTTIVCTLPTPSKPI